MISTETIEGFFEQLDWPFQRDDEHNWTTGYKGEKYVFPVYVRIDEHWLYIYTPLPAQVHPAVKSTFFEYLLRLNHEVNMAKFTMDDDDQIGFTVELPNDDLTVGTFETALRLLCLYMDDKYIDLVNRAANPPTLSATQTA